MGRRRDPSIAPRALKAALDVYARMGWSGFTFENVAKEARVGKPALYRRWENPAQLLVEAFELLDMPRAKDCGSLEADLRYLAREFIHWNMVPGNREIGTRVNLDREVNAELGEAYDRAVYRPRFEAVRAISERAKQRGELTPGDSSVLAVEMVIGALNMRITYLPREVSDERVAKLIAYMDDVVDVTVAGLHAQAGRRHSVVAG